MSERIYSNRIYITAIPMGISGFRKPSALGLVTGKQFRSMGRESATRRGVNLNTTRFRLVDGRLPEYQDRASFDEACEWLKSNPNASAVADPEISAH